MEKQLTIVVPDATGEEGLTQACKRGELFRNNTEIEKYFKQGYIIHHYSIVEGGGKSAPSGQGTQVRVFLEK
jgi:hypothetical protein